MVRVSSDGHIVNDDDISNNQRRMDGPSNFFAQNSRQTESETTGGFSTVWNSANERLRQYGLNSFHVAGYRVDPLHLVVAVLGFVLSGPMMLVVVIAAIVISQTSGDTTPVSTNIAREGSNLGNQPQTNTRMPKKVQGPFSGSGQRLG
ncbi:hypothetical protein V3C99_008042, partial [Haemonchus contortus]